MTQGPRQGSLAKASCVVWAGDTPTAGPAGAGTRPAAPQPLAQPAPAPASALAIKDLAPGARRAHQDLPSRRPAPHAGTARACPLGCLLSHACGMSVRRTRVAEPSLPVAAHLRLFPASWCPLLGIVARGTAPRHPGPRRGPSGTLGVLARWLCQQACPPTPGPQREAGRGNPKLAGPAGWVPGDWGCGG